MSGGVNYRLLYFFHGKGVAIVAHALTKEKEVPNTDINLAVKRKSLLEANPARHIHKPDVRETKRKDQSKGTPTVVTNSGPTTLRDPKREGKATDDKDDDKTSDRDEHDEEQT